MKRSRFGRWLSLGLALLSGCGATEAKEAQPVVAATPARSLAEELRDAPGALVARVGQLRGLPVRAPVPILLEDDKTFATALGDKQERDAMKPLPSQKKAFYLAFGFPLGEERAQGSSAAEVLDEQLVGFYDQTTRVVHVRRSRLERTTRESVVQAGLIAHEVEHALQHQRFGPVDLDELDTDEARLSRFALLEGDAMVVMVAHIAATRGVPLGEALAKVERSFEAGTMDKALSSDTNARALSSAPMNERARLLFPYTAGLVFMGALYRRGGFDLMNAAFSRPPESTEQILHPEKYLAGEGPIAVKAPEAPSGWKVLASGTMGELLTGVVLSQCIPTQQGARAARGWGGDAYTIAASPEGEVAVLWSTAWDDEEAAARFAEVMKRSATCWKPGGRTWKKYSLGDGFEVTQDKTRVLFVRGLPESERAGIVKGLLRD